MVPHGAFTSKSGSPAGLFVCSVEPIRVSLADGGAEWTLEGGLPRWEFVHADGKRSTDVVEIGKAIRCDKDTSTEQVSDRDATATSLRLLRESRYRELLKDLQLPLNAPKPFTVCWMQVQ
jgi:hypothetical protein